MLLSRYGADAFERFAAVPEGWLPPGNRVWIRYNGTDRCIEMTESRPLPFEVVNHGYWEIPSPKLGRELIEITDAWKTLREERDRLNQDLRNALYGFATEAALRDGWPEAYAHLAPPSGPTPNLPTVRVEDLNRRIAALREAA